MKHWSDYVVAIALFIPLLSLFSEKIQQHVRNVLEVSRKLIFFVPSALTFLNCWHNWVNDVGLFTGWKLAFYLFIPTVLLFITAKCSDPLQRVGDLLAVLIFWFPIDFRHLKGSWANDLWYPFSAASAIILAAVLFVCYRQLDGVNYNLSARGRDFGLIGRFLLYLVIILLPIGMATGFLSWNPNIKRLLIFPLVFAGIFLTTALAEEFLFRGLIQNMLSKILPGQTLALVLSTIIFGAGHLNNAVGKFTPPNFLYMFMATIAGIFYGLAYQHSKSLLVPAALHAMVDSIWGALFLAKQVTQ